MNWLLIAVLIIFALGFLIGWHRGAVKMTVSLVAAVLTIILACTLSPYVTDVLKNHTGLYERLQEQVQESMQEKIEEQTDQLTVTQQARFIEELPLPASLKDALQENNNSEVYAVLGVESFTSYLSGYVASLIIGVIGFILTFLLAFVLLRILGAVLNLVSRLPLIHGINKIAGAGIGIAEALVAVWLGCLLITMFAGFDWGGQMLEMVSKSQILTYIYDNNLFVNVLLNFTGNI